MMNNNDIIFIWLQETAKKLGYDLEQYNERMFQTGDIDHNPNKLYALLKYGESSTDNHLLVQELELNILTEDGSLSNGMNLISELISNYNLVYVDELHGYAQISTPEVSEDFIEYGDNFKGLINCSISFVISDSISDKYLIYVDDDGNEEKIFALDLTYIMKGVDDPLPLQSTGLAKDRIEYYTRTFSIDIYGEVNNKLVQKINDMWVSSNPSQVFKFKVGSSDKYFEGSFVLVQLKVEWELGNVLTYSLSFTEADE